MASEHRPRPTTPDAEPAAERLDWLARLDGIFDDAGYWEPLGARHWAAFSDEGTTLLVTFETVEAIRAGSPDGLPFGHRIAAARGWSSLTLIADGETWWRDVAVFRYFDRLVDDGFLEDFDHVVLYGAGAGGYAACAFSVAAPGATVLAVQARATQDPAIAGWDRRTTAARRLTFTDRYGYAPEMIDGTGRVFLVYDPKVPEDSMHAALFDRPFVTRLRCPNLGADAETGLLRMNLMPALIEAAAEDGLDARVFARLWRRRRGQPYYLKQLVATAEASGNFRRAAAVCRFGAERLNLVRFRRRLEDYVRFAASQPAGDAGR